VNYVAALRSRRSNSRGVSGALRAADAPPRPLARRRWDAGGPVDHGIWSWAITRRFDVPDPTIWQRIDDANSAHVEVHAFDDGWYQHYLVVPAGYTTVWARLEFQLAARTGDDRTRVFAVADDIGTIYLGVYWTAGQIELADDVNGDSVFGGATDISDTWRRLKVEATADPGGGNGTLRVYLDGAATPTVERSHPHGLVGRRLLYGLGSVGTGTTTAAHTMRLASLEAYAVDPEPAVPALSAGWAAAAPYAEVVDPLSAISLTPDPLSAQDGAAAGTVIGQLARTGGRGDGTWSLTGDLAAIATINGTSVELTTTVDTATHDGTTGTISYSGDSAGGSAADITTSLQVSTAATDLVLSTPAGGSTVSGTLDTSQPFQRLQMLPPAPTWMETQDIQAGVSEPGYAGSRTRCGLETIASPSDVAVIHVTSLSGGDEVGTLRWAATTTTDNDGNDISDKVVIVVFDVSGHITLGGSLLFRRGRRWFAGQTAPQASNGSGGVFIHGWVGGRRAQASELIIEHLRFIDGRSSPGDGGAFDVGLYDAELHDIVLRNCGFYWGVDETMSIMPDWPNKRRIDKVAMIDCFFAEPAYFSSTSDPRGKSAFLKYGLHRLDISRNYWPGSKNRAPGVKQMTSAAVNNNLAYDNQYPPYFLMKEPSWWGGDIPNFRPAGFTIFHYGNVNDDGPYGWKLYNQYIRQLPKGGYGPTWFVRHNQGDERGDGQEIVVDPDRDGHSYYDAYDRPQLWPYRAPLPAADTVAHVMAHSGPWPGDRCATDDRLYTAYQTGGLTVHDVGGGEDRTGVADFPDAPIAATTGQPPAVPANPGAIGANGLTVIENWLEQQHIAKGGAPYQDFDKRLRFPWGGIVTVAKDGTVTFEPEAMAAGREGVVEVTRADGSVVTVTCRAV